MSIPGLSLAILIGVSLGFFGGGGSILTVPLLVYVFGLAPKQAIASSLMIVGIASASGAVQHWRAGNIRAKDGLVFGLAGMTGAYLGGRASAFLDGGLLLLLFASMMLLTSAAMWRGRSPRDTPGEANARSPMKLAFQGAAVGSFTGLVGAGGGFLIVPALVLWGGVPVAAAIGTSLLIIVMNSIAGVVGYLSHVRIDYALVGAISATAVLGSLLGSRLAARVDPDSLRRAFAAFVMGMAVLILAREGALLAETLGPALPHTWPQVLFALGMLTIGAIAGRSSNSAERITTELAFSEGAGI